MLKFNQIWSIDGVSIYQTERVCQVKNSTMTFFNCQKMFLIELITAAAFKVYFEGFSFWPRKVYFERSKKFLFVTCWKHYINLTWKNLIWFNFKIEWKLQLELNFWRSDFWNGFSGLISSSDRSALTLKSWLYKLMESKKA